MANSMMGEQEQAALGEAVARAGAVAAEGDLTAAARAFADFPFNDEDLAVAEKTGYFEATGRYVPDLLDFFQQFAEYEGPMPDDPAVLGAISAPVLLLHGSDTQAVFTASARHFADYVRGARVQEIPVAGHIAPLTHPEALAEALTEFFAPATHPSSPFSIDRSLRPGHGRPRRPGRAHVGR